MKNTFLLLAVFLAFNVSAQRYVTKSGTIKFLSETPLENIEATNNKVMSAIDVSKQAVVVKVLIKSFKFEKALMEDHFNENYMESDDFPNSTFKGKFIDIPNMDSNEVQKVKISGVLNIHGQNKQIETVIDLQHVDGLIKASGVFNVKLSDFKIEIPSAVVDKLSDDLEISFDFNLKAL